jgi:hypothetical protein
MEAKDPLKVRTRQGMLHQLAGFLWANKLWWLLPILVVIGLLAVLAAVAAVSGPGAPFIYTLF